MPRNWAVAAVPSLQLSMPSLQEEIDAKKKEVDVLIKKLEVEQDTAISIPAQNMQEAVMQIELRDFAEVKALGQTSWWDLPRHEHRGLPPICHRERQ